MGHLRRTLTDDEWLQKTDPETWEHQQLITRIDRLEATVERLAQAMEMGKEKPLVVTGHQRRGRVNTL